MNSKHAIRAWALVLNFQQLALERGEVVFAYGVVKAVANRSNGRANIHIFAPQTESCRCVLWFVIGMMNYTGWFAFDVNMGEFLALLGPSGSGKTTILNMLAGFEDLSAGDILINGRNVAPLAPGKRNIGMVFQTAFAKIGFVICHDRRFPESWRALAVNGAELVFNPTAAHAGLYKKDKSSGSTETPWEIIGRSAAIQNAYYVAAVNRTGPDPVRSETSFAGDSFIADPLGEIIASTGSEEALVTAMIDLDLVRQVRIEWAYYRDRRPETYGDLTDLLK